MDLRLIRPLAVALALSFLPCPPAAAQEWARKMFATTAHDFGTVARGAKVEYPFTLENIYEEDVHISEVRSSCGCTSTTISNHTLKTWDKAEIVAVIDTRGFLGRKDATLTVVLDRPFPAEVSLQVHSFIRSDVVVQPGAVSFGTVEAGRTYQQTVKIDYAGRRDWRIERVESSLPYLEVKAMETSRAGDRVAYDLVVTLKSSAPAGHLQEHVVLVTNDYAADTARVPVRVEGVISPGLTAHPSPLNLGVVAAGQAVKRPLVVCGKSPFRVTAVRSRDPRFQCSFASEAKDMQIVQVTFTGSAEEGNVATELILDTDHAQCPTLDVPAFVRVAGGGQASAGTTGSEPAAQPPGTSERP
ncbi:MAG: DUF1573 domain-containing protein [Planctomycetota bacterium]